MWGEYVFYKLHWILKRPQKLKLLKKKKSQAWRTEESCKDFDPPSMGKWVFSPLPMDVNWTTAAFTSKMPGMSSGRPEQATQALGSWSPENTVHERLPPHREDPEDAMLERDRGQAAPRPQMRMEKSDLSGSCRPSCCQTDQRRINQPSPF